MSKKKSGKGNRARNIIASQLHDRNKPYYNRVERHGKEYRRRPKHRSTYDEVD